MKAAACSGGLGDIVFSIPVMRRLKITRMYVKDRSYGPGLGTTYSAIKPLLEHQGIECLPCDGQFADGSFPDISYTHNFDNWRMTGRRDTIHILKSMMLHFRCYDGNWNKPWLRGFEESFYTSNLIFLTPRWRDNSKVDWMKVMLDFHLLSINSYFAGLKEDHDRYFSGFIPHIPTDDMLQLTKLIARSKRLFCNQSVALAIAQGLGTVPYWLERKPGKTNTLIYSPHEHLLT